MSNQNPNEERESGLTVQEARPKLRRPPLFKVLLLNDDYTPMEFVVQVLETFFAMNREKATQIMLHVHTRGAGCLRCLYAGHRGDQGRCRSTTTPAAISIR